MKTENIVMCALFAALTAVFSQIIIPVGPVPISLSTLSVFCAGAILGPKMAFISQLVYVIIGLCGAPVFAMFRGGPGVLFGPTGGFIMGYIVASLVVGMISNKSNDRYPILFLSNLSGFVVLTIMGTIWYMITTETGFLGALTVCVLPFFGGDILKMCVACVISRRLRPVLREFNREKALQK